MSFSGFILLCLCVFLFFITLRATSMIEKLIEIILTVFFEPEKIVMPILVCAIVCALLYAGLYFYNAVDMVKGWE